MMPIKFLGSNVCSTDACIFVLAHEAVCFLVVIRGGNYVTIVFVQKLFTLDC